MDGGKPALKIDEVPLDWFYGDGVKLDFRSKPDGNSAGPMTCSGSSTASGTR